MSLALSPFELLPDTIICLHIPHGFNGNGQTIEEQLLELATRSRKVICIARPSGFEAGTVGLSPIETSIGWLSRVAGISQKASAQTIAGFGVKVAERVACNAGTPKALLGISAALAAEPNVLVYSTEGLDVEGCWAVHRFVASRCSSRCAVHISYPSVFGDGSPHPRMCPPGARCREVLKGTRF